MDLEEVIKKYQMAVIEHRKYSTINSKIANMNYDLIIKYYKDLKQTKEGIERLKKILHSDDPAIRCAVATHLLPFYENESISVLEELEKGDYKISSLDAEYVLKGWERGSLKKYLLSL